MKNKNRSNNIYFIAGLIFTLIPLGSYGQIEISKNSIKSLVNFSIKKDESFYIEFCNKDSCYYTSHNLTAYVNTRVKEPKYCCDIISWKPAKGRKTTIVHRKSCEKFSPCTIYSQETNLRFKVTDNKKAEVFILLKKDNKIHDRLQVTSITKMETPESGTYYVLELKRK